MIHLHARDADGRHTLDPALCRAAIDAVKRATEGGILVQMSSESAGIYGRDEQMAAVRAVMPDAVSLAVREIFPDADSEPDGGRFVEDLVRRGVRLQFIVYDPNDLVRLADLRQRGVVASGPGDVLFVLGKYSGMPADPSDLDPFLAALDGLGLAATQRWAVCAFGPKEHACVVAAMEKGGHVRVGFENNLCLADGSVAPDNAALVAEAAAAALRRGRQVADVSVFC